MIARGMDVDTRSPWPSWPSEPPPDRDEGQKKKSTDAQVIAERQPSSHPQSSSRQHRSISKIITNCITLHTPQVHSRPCVSTAAEKREPVATFTIFTLTANRMPNGAALAT